MTADQPQELSAIDIQREAGELVANRVYANVGALVEFCIKKAFEENDDDNPIEEGDIDFSVDASEWGAAKCKAYLEGNMGREWDNISSIPWLVGQTDEALDAVREWIREEFDEGQDDFEEAGPPVHYFGDDGRLLELDEWDAPKLFAFLQFNAKLGEEGADEKWFELTGHYVATTFADVEDEDEFEEELNEVRDYIRQEADQREVYEWWAVDSWLGARLKELDNVVIEVGLLTVWGRETTGQAIKMDGDIQQITRDLLAERAKYS